MCQPGEPTGRRDPPAASVMGPRGRSAWRTWLLIFSALHLLLWPVSNGLPVHTWSSLSREPRGEVLVVRMEAWRRCGSVALDPGDGAWSCCGLQYPFHRGSQRCCSTHRREFQVIPKDDSKSEYDDCRKNKAPLSRRPLRGRPPGADRQQVHEGTDGRSRVSTATRLSSCVQQSRS